MNTAKAVSITAAAAFVGAFAALYTGGNGKQAAAGAAVTAAALILKSPWLQKYAPPAQAEKKAE